MNLRGPPDKRVQSKKFLGSCESRRILTEGGLREGLFVALEFFFVRWPGGCLLKAEVFGGDCEVEEQAPGGLVSSGSELELVRMLDTDGLRDEGGDVVGFNPNELA